MKEVGTLFADSIEKASRPSKNTLKLLFCVLLAASFWLFPPPQGLSAAGWRLLGVFLATILSFLLNGIAMAPAVLIAMVGLAATGTLPFKGLVAGFGNKVVWLVVGAFILAGAVTRTGFGLRVALTLVKWLGKTTLGLGYAICGSELVLGPCVPSNTARGGGILAPIVRSLALALGSNPGKTPHLAGSYLVSIGAHANLITAAMFLTGMGANPLVAEAAASVFGIDFTWGKWALGALVPGLLALMLLPILMMKLCPPSLKDASKARQVGMEKLRELGPWRSSEKVMAGVFILLLLLWSTYPLHGLGSALVTWIGIIILIVTKTESWQNILKNPQPWDTLIWLGGLLALANALKSEGVISYFAANVESYMSGMEGVYLVIGLGVIYFYSMYAFSMLTAHISAMVVTFMTLALAADAPPMLTIPLLAYFSCLCACTTHYSTGPVVIYYGLSYVSTPRWFKVGFIMSLYHMAIWLGVGLLWWRFLGWW